MVLVGFSATLCLLLLSMSALRSAVPPALDSPKAPRTPRGPPPGAPGVSSEYDYSKSTAEVYRQFLAPGAAPVFVGEFAESRSPALIDYTWHVHYTPERQLLQDSIVRSILDECNAVPVTNPWVVFTAGAMGAGKSHVVRFLVRERLLPFECYLPVDPDAIKYMLPEMQGYLARDPRTAGARTHMESAYVQELVQHVGFVRGLPLIIDGSLRNYEFYRDVVFPRIRLLFPRYRIAIMHVHADPADVVRRAAQRASVTGRSVPRDLLVSTLKQVPKSVELLAPLVDLVVRVFSGDEMVLDYNSLVPGADWRTFAAAWSAVVARGEAPANNANGQDGGPCHVCMHAYIPPDFNEQVSAAAPATPSAEDASRLRSGL